MDHLAVRGLRRPQAVECAVPVLAYSSGCAGSTINGFAHAFSQQTPTSMSCVHSCSPHVGCVHEPIHDSCPVHLTSEAQILYVPGACFENFEP